MSEKSFEEYQNVPWKEYKVALPTGISMAYCECGPANGIPVILIHGVTDGRVSWSQVAPMMAELGYHCYIPEYRGNGKTDKPNPGPKGYLTDTHVADIFALMDLLNLKKCHVVGHSLGSLIAQRMNILHPERTLSITLIESAVKCPGNALLTWAQNGDGKDYLGVHGYDAEQKMPESFLKAWTENTNEDQSFQDATIAHAHQMPYPVWDYLLTGLNAFDNSADMGKITGRVLVIWATEDVIFTAEDQEELKKCLTNCDTVYKTVQGGTHNVHWDSKRTKEEVAAYIDDFIRA
jgi:pimeloyl-ACP methyl ester carboxylesterase